ncbi:MAG: hydantoinase/carbamoylase family amidase [Rubrobacter sp.]|nr:hydantoinase/carbamoylase family amidase [Rubrobacter sp.]
MGPTPGTFGESARLKDSVKSYIDLHIEQGKVLESVGLPVGVVTGIAGPVWLRFTVEREASHAGTTPMNLRRDALAAAALIYMIEEDATLSGTIVGIVGKLELEPGGINIIPSYVELSLNLRDIGEAVRVAAEERIWDKAYRICEERKVKLDVEVLQRLAPVPCSEAVRAAARESCEEFDLELFELVSGAGYDGMQLAELCPIHRYDLRPL